MAQQTFQQIIAALQESGWTQQDIADRVGVTQPTISRLSNGLLRSMDYEAGCRLVALRGAKAPPKRVLATTN